MKKRKVLPKIILTALIVSAAVTGCGKAENTNMSSSTKIIHNDTIAGDESIGVEIGKTAPDFEVELLNGDKIKLSDLRGKVVLLNFWATWCGPCVAEMPSFPILLENYPDDLEILAINCQEKKQRVSDHITENEYTFKVGLDTDSKISGLYPTDGIPYSIIINKEGVITQLHLGGGDEMYPVFEKYINKALENDIVE